MTDYTKLVRALRCCCPQPKETCDGCPYDTAGECNISRMMFDAAAAIEGLQAEVPKRGEWINHKDEHQCSVCRETVVVDEVRWEQIGAYDYCPNCGAKMEVQE